MEHHDYQSLARFIGQPDSKGQKVIPFPYGLTIILLYRWVCTRCGIYHFCETERLIPAHTQFCPGERG